MSQLNWEGQANRLKWRLRVFCVKGKAPQAGHTLSFTSNLNRVFKVEFLIPDGFFLGGELVDVCVFQVEMGNVKTFNRRFMSRNREQERFGRGGGESGIFQRCSGRSFAAQYCKS